MDPQNNPITEYWLAHYVGLLCSLCGNSGVIDTRGRARSAAGVECGRLNWCICPNGQCLRAGNGTAVPEAGQ